jgi:exonuclease III
VAEILKLLCLNIRNGGGLRWSRIVEFIDSHAPQVLVLTEWRSRGLPGAAESWATPRALKWSNANDGATKNGVLVAAKHDFVSARATPEGQSAGTLMRVEFGTWTVLACYFPQGAAKARYFEVCRNVVRDCRRKPLLIVGDMNTGNQAADKSPAGVKYACSEQFDGLSQIEGLIDLWRRSNGADAREWTWCTTRNGFRLDHAFGNRAFVDLFSPDCRYDHRPREDGFSDHSAIVIEAEIESANSGV